MLNDLLPMMGVILGAAIALVGTLVTLSFQKDTERIKAQKEIYESRFKDLEEYLGKYFQVLRDNLNGKDIAQDPERDVKLKNILENPYDWMLLRFLRYTEDRFINAAIIRLEKAERNVKEAAYSIQNYPDQEFSSIYLPRDEFERAILELFTSMDRFRLNGYRPTPNYWIKRFWSRIFPQQDD